MAQAQSIRHEGLSPASSEGSSVSDEPSTRTGLASSSRPASLPSGRLDVHDPALIELRADALKRTERCASLQDTATGK